jgi:hypothetical protein
MSEPTTEPTDIPAPQSTEVTDAMIAEATEEPVVLVAEVSSLLLGKASYIVLFLLFAS